MAILSAGACARKWLRVPFFSGAENGMIDLALGSVFFYFLAYLLTGFGIFSSQHAVWLWLILSLMVAFGSTKIEARQWFPLAKSKWAKIILAVPLFIIFLRMLEGLQLHLHGDAYITYLPAPRMWAAEGNFQKFVGFTQFFLSTSFESLFAWGTALMGLKAGAGLDLSQYFSQWCIAILALIGILLSTLALCKRLSVYFPVPEIYYPLVAVTALQVPSLRWTANLAKNDLGVAFWGMAGYYLTLFLAEASLTWAFLAGVVIGAAVIGKLTLTTLALTLALYVLVFSKKRFFSFALGGIVGGMPVFIRNYSLTGNPVFPWLSNLMPSPLLSRGQLAGAVHATAGFFDSTHLVSYLGEMGSELPLIGVLFLTFFLIRDRKAFLQWVLPPLLSAFLFILLFRTSTEIRYQNANLILLGLLSTYFSFLCLTFFPKRWQPYFGGVLSLAIVATSNIPSFTLGQIGSDKFSPISKALARMTGGETKLWIRGNLQPSDTLLLVGDPHLYYLIDYGIHEIHQTPNLDEAFRSQSPRSFLSSALRAPDRYLCLETDAEFWDALPQVRAIELELEEAGSKECKIHSSTKAQIWDLACLRKSEQLKQ